MAGDIQLRWEIEPPAWSTKLETPRHREDNVARISSGEYPSQNSRNGSLEKFKEPFDGFDRLTAGKAQGKKEELGQRKTPPPSLVFLQEGVALILVPRTRGNEINATFTRDQAFFVSLSL